MFTPPSATPRKVTQDEARQAAVLLGVQCSLDARVEATFNFATSLFTPNDVRTAFCAALTKAHPDLGGDAAAAPDRLKALTAARDTLLAWLAQAPKADCKECQGRGFVTGRWGMRFPCSRCA